MQDYTIFFGAWGFLLMDEKMYFKGGFFFLGFGSIEFVVVYYYTFSNKIAFLLSFLDPFKCNLA